MDVEEFCLRLDRTELSTVELAIALLWYFDQQGPGARRTAGELTRILRDSGLAEPHSTRLGLSMVKTKHVQKSGSKHLRLKPTSREAIRSWLADVLEPDSPDVNQKNGFLPSEVWENTRSYVDQIARQINACFEFELFDGAAVLCRRLVETLLIEAYEACGDPNRIKDSDQNYLMLRDIIADAVNGGLTLGRDAKRTLPKIKELGDRSAHNRRYTARKPDLDKIESGLRLVVDELIQLAQQK